MKLGIIMILLVLFAFYKARDRFEKYNDDGED